MSSSSPLHYPLFPFILASFFNPLLISLYRTSCWPTFNFFSSLFFLFYSLFTNFFFSFLFSFSFSRHPQSLDIFCANWSTCKAFVPRCVFPILSWWACSSLEHASGCAQVSAKWQNDLEEIEGIQKVNLSLFFCNHQYYWTFFFFLFLLFSSLFLIPHR